MTDAAETRCARGWRREWISYFFSSDLMQASIFA